MKTDINNAESISPDTEMLHDRSDERVPSYQNKSLKNIETHENYSITKSESTQRRCAEWPGIILQTVDSRVATDLQNESGNEEKVLPKDKNEKFKQLMSELIRLPVVNKSKSRIPKPVVQPYGSASCDGNRFVISKSNSQVVIQSNQYKREELVPKGQRHVTEPTMNYLDAVTELRITKKRSSTVKIDDRENEMLMHDSAIKCERSDVMV